MFLIRDFLRLLGLGAAPAVASANQCQIYYDTVSQTSNVSVNTGPYVPIQRIADVAVATTAQTTLSGEQTIDGVLTASSRILVWQQTTLSENGIYVTAAGAWVRASDQDSAGDYRPGLWFSITGGAVYGGRIATLTTGGAINPGVTAVQYSVSASSPAAAVFDTTTPGSLTHNKIAGNYTRVFVYCIGKGAGGGAGRLGAVNTVRCGGGGGGGASMSFAVYDYANFPSTVTYIVGLNGTGGAPQTSADNNGADGVDGGAASVTGPSGRMLLANGGTKGFGGTALTGAAGSGGTGAIGGTNGGAASTTGLQGASGVAATFNLFNALQCTGGAAGGGITALNVPSSGVVGGQQQAGLQGGYLGTGGTITGTNAIDSVSPKSFTQGGCGGASGGSSITTVGSKGGKGGSYGGGGGGGGAALNANLSSGGGGDGGDSAVAFFYV